MKPQQRRTLLLVGLAASATLAVLTVLVTGRHGLPFPVDDAVLAWSVGHRPHLAVAVARALTATGSAVVPYVLVVLAGAWAGRTGPQRVRAVALGALCLAAGQLVRYGVMFLVHRPRPPHAAWAAQASGWAFPSGHTTTAALAAGLVLVALRLRAPRGRIVWCAVVVCWGLAVGMTRAYLAVHWAVDVLGGWLFAVGWLGLCVGAGYRWLSVRLGSGVAAAGEQGFRCGAG
ncbi:phosphatase PAP2 family protein [Streptomyces sp. NPDC087440]|uniref:phosphatase PAP2 family protein n=1 Tax=Streptomyces sp. NPDC087440 TaxID=3365790 RepID=UPI00382C95DF